MNTREEIAKEMCKIIYICPDDCTYCETKEIMLWPLYSKVADYVISLMETEIKKQTEELLMAHENAMRNLENKHKENKELRNLLDYYKGKTINIEDVK